MPNNKNDELTVGPNYIVPIVVLGHFMHDYKLFAIGTYDDDDKNLQKGSLM